MPDDDALVRLVKLTSDVLPKTKRVAIVDGFHDGITIVRICTYTGPRSHIYTAASAAVYGGK